MNSETKIELSVIMPALNEEANICAALSETLQAFAFFNINGEIIAVNDGSRDKTEGLIKQKIKENLCQVRLIHHDTPRGVGASFWEGVEAANGAIVVMLPGDNENDPMETLRYYRLLEHVDIVIPFIFNRQARTLFRNALSFLYRFIINATFLVNFNYTNGTILYRKSILKEVSRRSSGFFFQTDILMRVVKKGYLFAEVPYKLGRRNKGVSKAVSFPSLWQVVRGYLRLIRDFYFNKKNRADVVFPSDSQTAARRQN